MLLNVSECSYHNEYFTLCFSPNHLWLLKLNYYLCFNCVINEPRDAEELGLSCISLRKPVGLSYKKCRKDICPTLCHWTVSLMTRCGHCKKLAPEWKTAAKNLKGKVKLGQVDCDADKVWACNTPKYLEIRYLCFACWHCNNHDEKLIFPHMWVCMLFLCLDVFFT